MEWLTGVEAFVALVLFCLVAFLATLWIRRRWLSGSGGVFDCALRMGRTPSGWALGMARYNGEEFQWYRVFSASFRPRVVLNRSQTTWGAQRSPEPEESMVLFTDHVIVLLHGVDRKGRPQSYELAMMPASVTGLMSWLEASPPGLNYQDIEGQ